MYLEVTRWHHVEPSLAFNSDPVPGTDIRPHPRLPLILAYIACVVARWTSSLQEFQPMSLVAYPTPSYFIASTKGRL